MNRTILVGRLTKDPELRYTPAGVPVATFTLAVKRDFKNGNGDYETDFVNIVVWRKPAENAANFLKKGSLAGVDGRISTRNYEGQDGKRVYVTEVVAESVQFLETKSSSNSNSDNNNRNRQNSNNSSRANDDSFANGNSYSDEGDDLPF